MAKLDTSLRRDMVMRHSDVIKIEDYLESINIIGAGSIGSFTALALAKMGAPKIRIFDDDKVESHNVGNQFVRITEDIDKPKVEVCREMLLDFGGIEPEIFNKKWEGEELEGIVVACPDKMAPRKAAFEMAMSAPGVSYFIDARMGLEELRIVHFPTVHSRARHIYETSWYSDEEADEDRCSSRTIIYTVCIAAAEIAKLIKQHITGRYVMPPHYILSINNMTVTPIDNTCLNGSCYVQQSQDMAKQIGGVHPI